ncbi:putative leucine-rich repeat receptor-like protein kinase [Panicum miliaceum]|uniref:Leucine-rich repeat receptor-like protein kinase n=1 Tax=Panicum miliaceum TaxID=4540 RepID=A0A3L6TF28_PANMI|nr:putative leucine-rich repeat receptor-like protein kinase [Panicum miliaceum]
MSRVYSLPLLVLPLLIAIAIPPTTSATPPASNTSVDILLSFLAALSLTSQLILLPSWNTSASDGRGSNSTARPHCAFLGVTCSAAGQVAALNLSRVGLSGELAASAPQLCSLPELAALDLSRNNFTGSVPPAFAECSALSALHLGCNGLSGALPPELLSSHQLQHIDLSSNALAGEIPAPSAGGLSPLQYLDLSNNSLSSAIPHELATNKLTGPMPDFPVHCVLKFLNVDSNQIAGELPRTLGNCGNLTKLYLSNKISGSASRLFRLHAKPAKAFPQQQFLHRRVAGQHWRASQFGETDGVQK